MPTLTIPDLPATTLEALRALADRHGRTVEEEARERLTAGTPRPPFARRSDDDPTPVWWGDRPWPAPPPGVTLDPSEAGVYETPDGLRRLADLRPQPEDLGTEERPDGLPPRRYSATMSEERKRVLEGIERRAKTRQMQFPEPEELDRWIDEGRERRTAWIDDPPLHSDEDRCSPP